MDTNTDNQSILQGMQTSQTAALPTPISTQTYLENIYV